MSNIFTYLVRDTGGSIPIDIGSGPLVDPVSSQGLNLNADGEIYCSNDEAVHYHSGVPFDANGRMVVEAAAVDYFDQSIPFTASGAIAIASSPSDGPYSQGLLMDGTGAISTLTSIRWFLTLNGTDAYMTIPEWSMLGYGDRIYFSFVADTLDASNQLVYDNAASDHDIKILATTDVLQCSYIDADTTTPRTIAGPTIVAGTEYTGYVEYKADGVDLIVNGVTFNSTNIPELLIGLSRVGASDTPGNFFDGTIHDIRLTSPSDPTNDRWYPIDDGPGNLVTNLLTYSEEFDNADWAKANATISVNSAIAPDGSMTADASIETTGTLDTHGVTQLPDVSFGTNYVCSVYAKDNGRDIAKFSGFGNGGGGVTFNLTTLATAINGDWSNPTITAVGDGWFRCVAQTVPNNSAKFIIASSNNMSGGSYTGDITKGLYIWGAQLVEGTEAADYVPTTDLPAIDGSFRDKLSIYERGIQHNTVDGDWTYE